MIQTYTNQNHSAQTLNTSVLNITAKAKTYNLKPAVCSLWIPLWITCRETNTPEMPIERKQNFPVLYGET